MFCCPCDTINRLKLLIIPSAQQVDYFVDDISSLSWLKDKVFRSVMKEDRTVVKRPLP